MGWYLAFWQSKIGSNVRKFWKNRVILLKIWRKIGPIGIWMGLFFLKNWYLYASTFKFRSGTSLPQNQTWVPPRVRFKKFTYYLQKVLNLGVPHPKSILGLKGHAIWYLEGCMRVFLKGGPSPTVEGKNINITSLRSLKKSSNINKTYTAKGSKENNSTRPGNQWRLGRW